jgi:hypothetical protein
LGRVLLEVMNARASAANAVLIEWETVFGLLCSGAVFGFQGCFTLEPRFLS